MKLKKLKFKSITKNVLASKLFFNILSDILLVDDNPFNHDVLEIVISQLK
jgi:hypothetical protein